MSPVPPPSRPHPAALPLTGPEDALSVVYAALSHPPRHESVLLLLDHTHRGLGCIVVTGQGALSTLAEAAVEFAVQEPALSALVLATVRPGCGYLPDVAHREVFGHTVARLDAVGVDLLDWFVVSGQWAASLTELTDSRPRWRSAP